MIESAIVVENDIHIAFAANRPNNNYE